MWKWFVTGADPGLQVGEGHIKKLRRAEGSANIFGIFRVKNHDFTKKIMFFNFRGGCRMRPPPLDAPLRYACNCSVNHERQYPHSSTLYRCVLNNICRFKTNYVYSINGGGAFPISRSIELFLSLFVIRGNGPNEYQMIYFN